MPLILVVNCTERLHSRPSKWTSRKRFVRHRIRIKFSTESGRVLNAPSYAKELKDAQVWTGRNQARVSCLAPYRDRLELKRVVLISDLVRNPNSKHLLFYFIERSSFFYEFSEHWRVYISAYMIVGAKVRNKLSSLLRINLFRRNRNYLCNRSWFEWAAQQLLKMTKEFIWYSSTVLIFCVIR